MHRLLVPLVVLALLGACAPGPVVRMHDVYLYGTLDARLTYFYGDEKELRYNGGLLSLTRPTDADRGSADRYVVAESLLVDGARYLQQPVDPLGGAAVAASRIPLTTDMMLRVHMPTKQIVYFDGNSFLLLADEVVAGNQFRVVPRPLFNRLRGMGQLSNGEAAMLENVLRASGSPAVLAFLDEEDLPPHSVDGLDDHRRTAIYIQTEVGSDPTAFRPTPTDLTWEVMARGDQALGFNSRSYELVRSEAHLLELWNRVNANVLEVPPVPRIDFQRETVVALFMGQQSTAGYGVSVDSVTEQNNELYLDVRFSAPGAGSMTAQVITSPWVMVRVLRGGYEVAWLRDPTTGNLIGAARAAF